MSAVCRSMSCPGLTAFPFFELAGSLVQILNYCTYREGEALPVIVFVLRLGLVFGLPLLDHGLFCREQLVMNVGGMSAQCVCARLPEFIF